MSGRFSPRCRCRCHEPARATDIEAYHAKAAPKRAATRRSNAESGASRAGFTHASAAYLRGASAEAQQSPADLAKFLRLHLGIRTKQSTRFLRLEDWDVNAGMVDEAQLAGPGIGGRRDLKELNGHDRLAVRSRRRAARRGQREETRDEGEQGEAMTHGLSVIASSDHIMVGDPR